MINDPIFINNNEHRIVNSNYVLSIEQVINNHGEKTGLFLEMSNGEFITISDHKYTDHIEALFFDDEKEGDAL